MVVTNEGVSDFNEAVHRVHILDRYSRNPKRAAIIFVDANVLIREDLERIVEYEKRGICIATTSDVVNEVRAIPIRTFSGSEKNQRRKAAAYIDKLETQRAIIDVDEERAQNPLLEQEYQHLRRLFSVTRKQMLTEAIAKNRELYETIKVLGRKLDAKSIFYEPIVNAIIECITNRTYDPSFIWPDISVTTREICRIVREIQDDVTSRRRERVIEAHWTISGSINYDHFLEQRGEHSGADAIYIGNKISKLLKIAYQERIYGVSIEKMSNVQEKKEPVYTDLGLLLASYGIILSRLEGERHAAIATLDSDFRELLALRRDTRIIYESGTNRETAT